MFTRVRCVCALLVPCLGALAWAPHATAQGDPPTAGQIVEQCVGEIGMSTRTTADDIGAVTRATIERIVGLASEGADPEALVHAAREGSARAAMRARAGNAQVSAIRNRCLRALHEIGAGPAPGFTVKGAALTSYRVTHHHLATGVRAIHEALRRALDGDGADGGVVEPAAGVTPVGAG